MSKKKPSISLKVTKFIEDFNKRYVYNFKTGNITYKENTRTAMAGTEGAPVKINKRGVAIRQITIGGVITTAARAVWIITRKEFPPRGRRILLKDRDINNLKASNLLIR